MSFAAGWLIREMVGYWEFPEWKLVLLLFISLMIYINERTGILELWIRRNILKKVKKAFH